MSIRALVLRTAPDDETREKWERFLEHADFATHYTSPKFFDEPFFGPDQCFAILAVEGNDVVGVLTGLIDARQLSCGLIPRPQISLSKDAGVEVERALASALKSVASGQELITVYSWRALSGFEDEGFRVKVQPDSIVLLDLSLGAEKLLQDFSESRRRNIRKALRAGKIEISDANTAADYEEYYPIYVEWCKGKRLPAVTYDTLVKAFELRESRRLFLARFEGRVIAGAIVRFYRGGVVEYAANSSTPEALTLRPNDLLHWHIINWAVDAGFSCYSLGGAHTFLRRFGGTLVSSYRLRQDRSLFRVHDTKEACQRGIARIAGRLPSGAKERLRRLVGGIR